MATTRLYRDFTSDDDFGVPSSRRTLSLKATYEPPPRPLIQDTTTSPQTLSHETDIARGISDGRSSTSRNHHYGTGTAHTTDDEESTAGEESSFEPALHDVQEISAEPPLSNAAPYILPIDFNEKSAFSPSVTSMSNDAQSSSNNSSASRLPEFFGHTTFQVVLQNPAIAHQFMKFAQSRLCAENLEFLRRVNKYHDMLQDVSKAIADMHKDFFAGNAANQLNLPEPVLHKANHDMKFSLSSTLPTLESIFASAESDVERLVYSDIYPKFVRYQMSRGAAKALGGNRNRYNGLGDSFVLTDPAKADNPIMYASDGFVKVTGYTRSEIIPRNCRFLQNRQTDVAAVRRLKAAIDKREESVELLLNQKKNGEPFWNLLCTIPLFDNHGKCVFFLGGQINCSTAIHNASDILRILAQGDEPEEEAGSRTVGTPSAKPSRSRTILSALRGGPKTGAPARTPGMEGGLLGKIEDMDLKDQIDTFYTAYSNFLIINYSTFLISFVSVGITDSLFPIKAKAGPPAQAVGTDIFKFLSNHSPNGSLGWDFKSAVKSALKGGQPVSLDLKLCARPYMGFERFALHWTPLKDERGAVQWVVLTLGSETRA